MRKRSRDGAQHVVLVGGGLHNGVIALALLDAFPELQVTLLERATTLGGNHTWSFHAGDIEPRAMSWLGALIGAAWPAYEVRFPGHSRRIDTGYFSIFSERFHELLCERFEANRSRAELRLGCEVSQLGANRVVCADRRELDASVVLDARGPERLSSGEPGAQAPRARLAGYQKFVGLELALSQPISRRLPLLMDACVPQTDGFRFVYVLPLPGRRVLIEDTYYADAPELDVAGVRAQLLAYAERSGLHLAEIVREEQGVLPLPTRLQLPRPSSGPWPVGYAAGCFHPTTGYSLALAVAMAEYLRQHGPQLGLSAAWRSLHAQTAPQQRFACLLNRLLFRAIAPEQRYRVLERFYRLPEDTIARFYALQLTASDRARIVCGKPPSGMSLYGAFDAGVLS